QFERTLLTMAEYMRKTDPEKADLLVRALRRSSEDRVSDQMQSIVKLLESKQLGDAHTRQQELITQMRSLLQLLQSQHRLDELKAEQERIKDLIKDVRQLINREKDVRAET